MSIKQEIDSQGLIKVRDFWNLPHDTEKWRSWRKIECRGEGTIQAKTKEIIKILEQRKILTIDGQDQLRW